MTTSRRTTKEGLVFTVIDRSTLELRDTGLTLDEVLDQHVPQGHQSAALSILRNMAVGAEVQIGAILARRTG